jgi:hypothetical protein
LLVPKYERLVGTVALLNHLHRVMRRGDVVCADTW